MNFFRELPDELKVHVFLFLDATWVCKTASLVCRDWMVFSEDSQLWAHFYRRRWAARDDHPKNMGTSSINPSAPSAVANWKLAYKYRLQLFQRYNSMGEHALQELVGCASATDWVSQTEAMRVTHSSVASATILDCYSLADVSPSRLLSIQMQVANRSGVTVYFRNAILPPAPLHKSQAFGNGPLPDPLGSLTQLESYKCFKTTARLTIPSKALMTLLLDTEVKKRLESSTIKFCQVLSVLDQTLDVTYVRYLATDILALRKISVQSSQILIASQSIAEDNSFFRVPCPRKRGSSTSSSTAGPPLTPRGATMADALEDLDPMPVRIGLRGTGFIVQPLSEHESMLINVLQLKKSEWMDPAVVDQIARQRVLQMSALQNHYDAMIATRAASASSSRATVPSLPIATAVSPMLTENSAN